MKNWMVKSRKVNGWKYGPWSFSESYREFIVISHASAVIYGPFAKRTEANRQAEFLNKENHAGN